MEMNRSDRHIPASVIGFSLIGGSHQFLHGLPVAAALSRRPGVTVTLYVTSKDDARIARDMMAELGAFETTVQLMELPPAVERLAGRSGWKSVAKTMRLLWWSRHMRKCDCIVALERTSALLTRLPGRCPLLVQIPHGVGGARRAGGGGIDRRFASFDLALVAGEADRRTTVALGLMPPERVIAVGQVKLAGLSRLGKLKRHRLFANDRPTILYNPHFHPRRGSWDQFGRDLIRAVAEDGTFNLIVAPHMRLFADLRHDEGAALEALSDPDWLLVDTSSQRLVDMTYTLGADIYLGDFSSQLYEWLAIPRPCVFIDQLGDGGIDDTKLPGMWKLGETVTSPGDLMPALRRASEAHPMYSPLQIEAMRDAVGDVNVDAAELAADQILALLNA
jgi:hypothetical protein